MQLNYLKERDPAVARAIEMELEREENTIELIASENFVSPAVLEAMGSVMTNKYAEGYPGDRYYGGCYAVDEVERLARDRLLAIYGAEHANVQPHAGANANMAVYLACLKPGDTVLGMDLSQGGHLTHGSKANISGKYFNYVHYGLNPETERIDYDAMREKALECKPKLIVAGASAYPRIIDFRRFREVADEVGALLMVDMAHIAGLVAAGEHPSPVAYADFVTSTTHKTLRGPRGAFILCKKEWAKKIDSAVFPGLQGGPLMHIIAAKAVAFAEAQTDGFREYQHRIVENAKAMADRLKERGMRLISGGTDNHLILCDVTSIGVNGRDAEKMLERVAITCNKNSIPNETLGFKVTSGIRLGTAAVTTRGATAAECCQIANWIVDCLTQSRPEEEIRAEVLVFCKAHPLYS